MRCDWCEQAQVTVVRRRGSKGERSWWSAAARTSLTQAKGAKQGKDKCRRRRRAVSLFEFSGDQTFGRRHRLQTVDATGDDDELTPGTLPPCPPARLPSCRAPSEVVRFGGNGNVCKPAAASLARTNIFPENPSPLPSLYSLPLPCCLTICPRI